MSADIETGCFLGQGTKLPLNRDQQERKQRMLDCFATQRETLKWFRSDDECIRRAPRYNFYEPPHAGRLFYESYDWGVNASEWLRLAQRADRMIAPCLSR